MAGDDTMSKWKETYKKSETIIEKFILPLLFVLVIVLKLTGVIEWSWWVVLSPALLFLGLIIIILAYCLITGWLEARTEEKDQKK